MDNGKEFGQGIFSDVTNHIYWLLLLTIYFVLTNVVFLFFLVTLIPSISNIIIYFLALIPTGPSISALCYSIGKLIREKEISPTKDFFYGYKLNFIDTLKCWLPLLLVISVLVIDLKYFNVQDSVSNQILGGLLLVVLILTLTVSLYVFLINANFNFRIRDIYRLSVFYCFTKVKATIGNIGIVIMTVFVMYVISDFIILFLAGIVCYALMMNSKQVMEDIELNFIKKT
ncbi:YesL family protein [Virgibacillus necropolis]|uniref:DUF624 domain-containing protein n=1 Tax=Virgibacillus necropolis TaxID=163877 RepID=UPI00384DAE36